jgi:hypothetical protein
MRLSTILLAVALICAGYISAVQNATINNQRGTIRAMTQNPSCMVGTHGEAMTMGPKPQHRGERTSIWVEPSTPVPPHKRYLVSEN